VLVSIILSKKVRTYGRPKGTILTTINLSKRLRSGRELAQKIEKTPKRKENIRNIMM